MDTAAEKERRDENESAAKSHGRDNVAKAASAFDGILSGQDVPFGERSNCYVISDTLIVLEAPADAEIYSTDGDVHAICDIVGQPQYSEVPTPQ